MGALFTKLAAGAMTVMTEVTDPSTTVEETTKWFEDVNEFFSKPGVEAAKSIGIAIVIGLVVYHLGIKKLLKKVRK